MKMVSLATRLLATLAGFSLAAPALHAQVLLLRLKAMDYNASTGTWTADIGSAAVQGTAGLRPTLITGVTPNGAAAVHFDGVDDRLVLSTVLPAGTSYTAFAFLRPNDLAATVGGTIFAGAAGSFDYRMWNEHQDTSRQGQADLGAGNAALSITGFSSVNATVSASGGTYRVNGVADGVSSPSSFTSGITNIGSHVGNAEFFSGDIAEIRVYSGTMTDAQRQAVEQELTTAYVTAAPGTPIQLRCENREAPLGVDAAPQLSWQLAPGDVSVRGLRQTAYQILVASTPALLAADTGDLWDSGKTVGSETLQILYAGTSLTTSKKVYWKVRSWDAADVASPWSAQATWTMGVVTSTDWKGKWITPSTAASDVKSTMIRREFTVSSGLVRGVVHVSGLGQYEMSLNGSRIGIDLFSPGWTKYDKTVLYDTYDVTPQLRIGTNAVGIMLGNGMYNIPTNSGRYVKFTGTFGPRKAIAQIRLEFADGSVQTIGTDATWKWAAGPSTFNTTFGGEDYDNRLEKAGWDSPGFKDTGWLATTVTTGPGGTLRGASYAAPPLRKRAETFLPTPALVPTAASKVYDFGQNASNVPTLKVYGPAGATVKLSSAEVGSTSGSGSITQINNPSYSLYTLRGSTAAAPETFIPRFVYIGHRYLKVDLTGGATVVSLTTSPVHSASPVAGDFSCSKQLFNDIHRIIRWAQRSNLASVITDCPTREKLGWLEQYHLHGPSLRYSFDLSALYRKTYTDMADSQTSTGFVPTTAPEYPVFDPPFRDSPEWSSSFVLSPEQQYDFYGDLGSITRHYANIKRYVEYLRTKASANIINYGLGDWYDLGPNPPGNAQLTPIALTATAIYYADVRALAAMAQRLGQTTDANTYTTLAGNIQTSFNNQFYNAVTGSYSTGSQTANAMPLALGLVDSANQQKVVDALVAQVRKDRNSVTAGDIGHRYLLRALADAGRSDVIYDLHSKTTGPGYGYILSLGYTALTEGWDGSNSKDHFMLGHIMEWFYHDLAGIRSDPTGPGFKKIIFRPTVVGDVTWANATYASIRGSISSNWILSNGQFTLGVTVPPGTTATVYLPTLGTPLSRLTVQESGTTLWQNGAPTGSAPGVTYDHTEQGNLLQSAVAWVVDSGTYTFTAQLTPPPMGVAATAGDSQVTLTWNPADGAADYNVKRATTTGGPYTEIAHAVAGTSFTDTTALNGLSYFYVVTAEFPAGESASSFEVTATPAGNLGFETPRVASYQYNPTGSPWTFTAQSGANGSGISANGSAFTSSNPPAPEGTQVAFLQGLATISKNFATTPGVSYSVVFSAAQRVLTNVNGQTWDLRKDGATISSYAPAQSATAYTNYSATFLASAASHTLSFVGTDTRGGDNTVFIDNIRITPLP